VVDGVYVYLEIGVQSYISCIRVETRRVSTFMVLSPLFPRVYQ